MKYPLDDAVSGDDFDLELRDASTNDVFSGDQQMIQRNATLIVRRVPSKPPFTASRYLVGVTQGAQVSAPVVIGI